MKFTKMFPRGAPSIKCEAPIVAAISTIVAAAESLTA
jgi:hypothetical protein